MMRFKADYSRHEESTSYQLVRILQSLVIDLQEVTDPTGVFHLNTSFCLDSQNADENEVITKLCSDHTHDDNDCLVLSCLVLSCLVLSCLVLSCLVLSCLVLSCVV